MLCLLCVVLLPLSTVSAGDLQDGNETYVIQAPSKPKLFVCCLCRKKCPKVATSIGFDCPEKRCTFKACALCEANYTISQTHSQLHQSKAKK